MKTLSDVKSIAAHLNLKIEAIALHARIERQEIDEELFKLYDEASEIQKVLKDLENCQNGEYDFDSFGELIYLVEVPKGIRDLPSINDYLTQDYANIYPHARSCGNDLYIFQTLGDYIGINWNADTRGRQYFVYEGRKEIIAKSDILEEGHPTISEEDYVRARIELYQREKGEFNDVVEVDRNGGYSKHFDMKLSTTDDINLDAPTDEELKKLINDYENYTNEEEN